jgi:hypothetical protein
MIASVIPNFRLERCLGPNIFANLAVFSGIVSVSTARGTDGQRSGLPLE